MKLRQKIELLLKKVIGQRLIRVNTNKVVIKIVQGSVVTITSFKWANYVSPGCKFPIRINVYVPKIVKVCCQYTKFDCINNQQLTIFFWATL